MDTLPDVPGVVCTLLLNDERTFPWLSRATGIPYKIVLRELKHRTRPMDLEHALLYAEAFGVTVGQLVNGTAPDVVAARLIRRKAA